MNVDIPSIITAVGTILLGWFTYNQYTKNKMTDLKLERIQQDQAIKQQKVNTSISIIYGELWRLLHELKASRVVILQPHPLNNHAFITITFEVVRTGVSNIKSIIQNDHISNYAKMCSDLATRDFIYFQSVSTDCSDKRFRSITQTNGVDSLMIKRLTDEVHDWTGSLFVDFSDKPFDGNIDYSKSLISDVANNIQYILPEIIEYENYSK